jgi:hypothetical protein
MKTNYTLYQMAFDGATVKDSEHETIEQAQDASANLGSKWHFYPLSIIVKGKTVKETGGTQCFINTGEAVLSGKLKNKRFTTVKKLFANVSKLSEMYGVSFEDFEQYIIESL